MTIKLRVAAKIDDNNFACECKKSWPSVISKAVAVNMILKNIIEVTEINTTNNWKVKIVLIVEDIQNQQVCSKAKDVLTFDDILKEWKRLVTFSLQFSDLLNVELVCH